MNDSSARTRARPAIETPYRAVPCRGCSSRTRAGRACEADTDDHSHRRETTPATPQESHKGLQVSMAFAYPLVDHLRPSRPRAAREMHSHGTLTVLSNNGTRILQFDTAGELLIKQGCTASTRSLPAHARKFALPDCRAGQETERPSTPCSASEAGNMKNVSGKDYADK